MLQIFPPSARLFTGLCCFLGPCCHEQLTDKSMYKRSHTGNREKCNNCRSPSPPRTCSRWRFSATSASGVFHTIRCVPQPSWVRLQAEISTVPWERNLRQCSQQTQRTRPPKSWILGAHLPVGGQVISGKRRSGRRERCFV